MGSDAFHCVIALGYGLETGEIGSIVEGLAYAFSHHVSQGDIHSKSTNIVKSESDLMYILGKVKRFQFPTHDADGFTSKMTQVSKIDHFPFDISYYDGIIENISHLAACVFSRTGGNDFFL